MSDPVMLANDPPDDYEDIGSVMSNFDHQIEEGAEEKLKSGKFYGEHPAWNFHGVVWWDGTQFAERVKCYQVVRGVYRADTLRELMQEVNSIYGSA